MEVAARPVSPASIRDRFDRPIFIVSTPRSGSTLLFETLAQAPSLHSIGGESHGLIEGIPSLSPAARQWASNRLTADDADPDTVEQLGRGFYGRLRDRDGNPPDGRIRMLEKTPKNALRVPFLDAVWPDAIFVYLYREARESVASMIEAWMSGRFRTYPRLPGWDGPQWSLLLVPGWQRLNGRPIPEIVAEQWAATTHMLLDDLDRLPRERLRGIVHGEFVADPRAGIETLARSLDLAWDRPLGPELPLSRHTVSRPAADKWRAIEGIIEEVWPIVAKADARAREFVGRLKP